MQYLYWANILEDKQKNLQNLHGQDEMKNADYEELTRKKQEVLNLN